MYWIHYWSNNIPRMYISSRKSKIQKCSISICSLLYKSSFFVQISKISKLTLFLISMMVGLGQIGYWPPSSIPIRFAQVDSLLAFCSAEMYFGFVLKKYFIWEKGKQLITCKHDCCDLSNTVYWIICRIIPINHASIGSNQSQTN